MLKRRAILLGVVGMFAAGRASSHKEHHSSAAAPPATPAGGAAPTRIVRHYLMPDVPLRDQAGLSARLREELRRQGPILMNFMFTTCPGICPILSATFARTAALLDRDIEQVRLWSISLDPDFDTPERLSQYGAQHDAPPQWRFFTGEQTAVRMIRRAFDADSDNKMAHRALVLLRSKDNTWVRFEGVLEPELLAAEIRTNLSAQ